MKRPALKLYPAIILAALLPLSAVHTQADEFALNPQVTKIVNDVSEARIKATIEHLVSFGTRNTMSDPNLPDHGVGAARQWIFNELKSYSPRLQVRFDKWRVKKQGMRIFKDVDLYDVVAVLPGKTMPETQVAISGHYDSLNLGNRPAGGAAAGPGNDGAPANTAAGAGGGTAPSQNPADYEKNAELPAPGACDDGSGTAAVMELARVMSQYEFDKTVVFIAFAGEEQGLIGSSLEAVKAKKEGAQIEALLNNDIIGTDMTGDGRMDNTTVAMYSDEIMDSPSQELARYARSIAERYLPYMKVNPIFFGDRIGRGGDHTPFQWEGYAAVRISTPNEIYANQHHATDTLENMSVPYTARVTRVNAAVLAALAIAPKPPIVTMAPRQGGGAGRGRGTADAAASAGAGSGGTNPPAAGDGGTAAGAAAGRGAGAGAAGGRRPSPMITRGGGYDAVLRWRPAGSEDNIKGYSVVIRPTTTVFWQQEIFVGKVNTFTLKGVSIDDLRFGVKAIGNDGSESLVTPYVTAPRQKVEIQTVQ